MLYKARKFDIRIWCLAHSCGDFFFYETGYLRTTSAEYKLEEMECSDMNHFNRHLVDPDAETLPSSVDCMHFTNNCL